MIHLFHGFLGSPEDFRFLQRDGVVLHDLYKMENYPEINPEDTLIGYSLGGRIALEIAENNDYKLQRVVLISTGPGLSSDEERVKRKSFEDPILKNLKSMSRLEFMEYWNKLSLFEFDSPLNIDDEERFKQSAAMFDRYRLSNQKDHLPQILKHKNKIQWIMGTLDEKYMTIAQTLLIPHGIRVSTIKGGHRLFQHQEALLKILNDENII